MPDIRQFLQAMAKPPAIDSTPLVDTIITTQDFQKGFKKSPTRSPQAHQAATSLTTRSLQKTQNCQKS